MTIESSHFAEARFFDRARTLQEHAVYEWIPQLGSRPADTVDVPALEAWGNAACELIYGVRYTACESFHQKASEVVRILIEITVRLEKVATYFYNRVDPAHEALDLALVEVHWHLLGEYCDVEMADHFYRRSTIPVETISQRLRQQGRAVASGTVAERYLDGVGTDKDSDHAWQIFAQFMDLDTIEQDLDSGQDNFESQRLTIRYLESRSPNRKTKETMKSLANHLWQAGYLSAATVSYRLNAHSAVNVDEIVEDESDDEDTEDEETPDEDAILADQYEGLSKAKIKELLNEELAKLDGMVGLRAVKKEVTTLVAYEDIQQIRRRKGHTQADPPSRHLVFVGNPGTGKTTVARILAKIYRLMGVLKKDVFVETNQAGLIGGYIGQTAIKTEKVVKSARGGMLFIDEAYGLTSERGNDYGQEAVNILIKAMEDYRAEMIVVAAGYTADMERFLESNPGLRSRFSKTLDFEDYTPSERVEILLRIGDKKGVEFNDGAKKVAAEFFVASLTSKEARSNGRFVRNFCERCIDLHHVRLSQLKKQRKRLTSNALTTILAEDAFNAAHEFGIAVARPVAHAAAASEKKTNNVVSMKQRQSSRIEEGHAPSEIWLPLRPVHIRYTTIGVLS